MWEISVSNPSGIEATAHTVSERFYFSFGGGSRTCVGRSESFGQMLTGCDDNADTLLRHKLARDVKGIACFPVSLLTPVY